MKAIVDLLATVFYSGKIPISPGTMGTLATLALVFMFPLSGPYAQGVFAIVALVAALIVTEAAIRLKLYGAASDPKQIVIDEFAGYAVALWGVDWSHRNLLIAFVLFRLFDILKPPPVSWLEKLPGSWGIVMDDIMAGVLANIGIRLLFYFKVM